MQSLLLSFIIQPASPKVSQLLVSQPVFLSVSQSQRQSSGQCFYHSVSHRDNHLASLVNRQSFIQSFRKPAGPPVNHLVNQLAANQCVCHSLSQLVTKSTSPSIDLKSWSLIPSSTYPNSQQVDQLHSQCLFSVTQTTSHQVGW